MFKKFKKSKKNTSQSLPSSSRGVFENNDYSLKGKSKGKSTYQSPVNPDLTKMGIGGLDKEFSSILRRAFTSRVFSPDVVEAIGMKHVRGILLYGPPGTGKTLIARQIGKMLNAREPKIVNGPEILAKYVGESEKKMREVFANAENEQKQDGRNSGLHIIIFDEIDAICKSRGSLDGNSAVNDTVVNQLLAKLDGVEQLNNILVIGTTNRKDMIDKALLRPGRLEVHIEIGLPDEAGRLQILQIHTAKMVENNKLASDVDLKELAALTKNFSGAEIEGLVRAAQSTAMNRLIKVDPDARDKLRVSRSDFMHALQNDIKPAFGSSKQDLQGFLANGIIKWGKPVSKVVRLGEDMIKLLKNSDRTMATMLLEGPPGSGKTTLAATIAELSDFPFVKFCTPENMINFSKTAKCQAIKNVFDDAYKSPWSCIIIDNIEQLIDYVPTDYGPKFSNCVLQTLLTLLKKAPPPEKKLFVIGTTSCKDNFKHMKMLNVFSKICHVPNISKTEDLMAVLDEVNMFNEKERDHITKETTDKRLCIGIKNLLFNIDLARQTDETDRAETFLDILEEENALHR